MIGPIPWVYNWIISRFHDFTVSWFHAIRLTLISDGWIWGMHRFFWPISDVAGYFSWFHEVKISIFSDFLISHNHTDLNISPIWDHIGEFNVSIELMVNIRVEHFSPFPGDINQELKISCEIALLEGNWESRFSCVF